MDRADLKVLLVEDNPADVLFLREALAQDALAVFHLTVVESLAEALACQAEQPFAAALLDLGLPDSLGLETFLKFHHAAPNLPVVVLSALDDEQIAQQAVQAGAQDYLVKRPQEFPMAGRAIRYAVERQNLRQSLQDSEQRFSTAFHSSPACQIITTLPDGLILDVNEAFCRLMEYERDELVNHTTQELEFWADAGEREAAFQAFFTDGRLSNREVVYRTRSGKYRTVIASVEPLEIKGVPCVISTSLDITARKLAEEKVSESEARLKTVLGNAPITIFAIDAQGRFTLSEGKSLKRVGLKPGENVGVSAFDLYASLPFLEAGRTVTGKEIMERVLAGETVEAVNELRGVYFDNHIGPIHDTDGKVVGIVGVATDITERKQAEQEVREARELFQKIFITSPIPIALTRISDRTVVDVNAAMENLLGYTRAELVGKPTTNFDYWADPQERQRAFEILLGEETLRDFEFSFKTRAGVIGQAINYTEVFHQGEEKFFLSIFVDITARKQAEERRRQAEAEQAKLREQLHQAQKLESIGQLAGGIAHDFNNLLVPIIGYAELGMMKLNPNDRLYANFSRIQSAAQRAANLTGQILAFSRKQILEMKVIDLNALVTDFEKMLSRLIREDIVLQIRPNPRVRPIKADPSQIDQVLLNLVVNARDAMPNGGTLTIETDLVDLDEDYAAQHPGVNPGMYALLTVSDTGHGMDAATRQRIFEPFFTTKARGHGTGLGLATVFGIVKQHQGNIWVYSEPGQGSAFKVYLPVLADETMRPSAAPEASVEQFVGNETILVVEDDAGARELVVHSLQTYGYAVLEAAQPAEALELVAGYPDTIHLLLTDVVMPGMNGQQMYTELKQQRPDLRVLYVSGYTDDVIVHHGMLDPGVAFLAKPFATVNLLRKIREVLR